MKKYALPLIPIVIITLSGFWLHSALSSPSNSTQPIEQETQASIKEPSSDEAFLSSFDKQKILINNEIKKHGQEKKTITKNKKIEKSSPTQIEKQNLQNNEHEKYNIQEDNLLKDADKLGSKGNQKPQINKEIQQQLQTMIYAWDLTESTSIRYSFSIHGLFYDEDDDFITTKIHFSYPGLSLINKAGLTLVGTPIKNKKPTKFIISAKDDHHGEDESSWAQVSFSLPSTEDSNLIGENALIGQTLYRLETSKNFLGSSYDYEIVYCEAFKFINNIAFYAASTNKQTCPKEDRLTEIGTYQADENQLILTSNGSVFNAEQHWEIKHEYKSSHKKGESLLTTVHNGKKFETYTILKNKAAMESRLNVVTGEYPYQMEKFEYFLPKDMEGHYIKGTAGMYMMDSRLINPNWRDLDSDLNINSDTHDVTCKHVLSFYQSSILGGKGVYADITTSSLAPNNIDPIECEERINSETGKRYSYLDLDYSNYDELVNGEVYSYVLKPKPELAHLVEEFKINLIYHEPNLN
ncbi:hypothetical protein [Aliivibrio sifiae]|uniref:Uncharacterized protein n=1 Tax=Aliivibrio sifiae TaxID=566293 RepID=A0A2S7WZQ3_9GAMM|nr:hypothetical protein [Aliivibrio sifiae]PQJ83067.1 hypothetical protein BTO22_19320 [Aliivibrio sifiae]